MSTNYLASQLTYEAVVNKEFIIINNFSLKTKHLSLKNSWFPTKSLATFIFKIG